MKALALALLISLSAPAQAQYQYGGSQQKSTYGSGTGCGDKLQVTAFTVTPSNPMPGQTVTAKMTVKHLCSSGSVNVPWKLFVGSTQIGSGTKSSLAAGATFDATATWTAVSGQHLFDGAADPDKTLGESGSNHANNYPQSKSVNVPKLVTQVLKWSNAANAGAQFPASGAIAGYAAVCSPIGQFDPVPASFPDFAQFSVVYSVNCLTPPAGYAGSGDLEAFKSFQLKNGWKVKEITEQGGQTGVSTVTFSWVSKPSNGSANPYLKVKLTFSAISMGGATAALGQPATFLKGVKVTIEGPEGTSPY